MTAALSFLTLNIGNPSEQRAQRQLAWLTSRQEHVLVLTETKASTGCRLLADGLTDAGWQVSYPIPEAGGYGVMIATTVRAEPGQFGDRVGYLPARAASVILPVPSGPLEVIGAYVPSRDASPAKIPDKIAAAAAKKQIPVVAAQNVPPNGIHFGTKLAAPCK